MELYACVIPCVAGATIAAMARRRRMLEPTLSPLRRAIEAHGRITTAAPAPLARPPAAGELEPDPRRAQRAKAQRRNAAGKFA